MDSKCIWDLPNYTWRFCFVPPRPQYVLSFLLSLLDETEHFLSLGLFPPLEHSVEVALQGSAWNMVPVPELFHTSFMWSREYQCHFSWRIPVVDTGGPRISADCIWGPGFPRPLFPPDFKISLQRLGLAKSGDAALAEAVDAVRICCTPIVTEVLAAQECNMDNQQQEPIGVCYSRRWSFLMLMPIDCQTRHTPSWNCLRILMLVGYSVLNPYSHPCFPLDFLL